LIYVDSTGFVDLPDNRRLDIVAACGSAVGVLISNGNGTFKAGGGAPSSIAVGSFRGNGITDLAAATNSANGGIVVLLGNGDGTFQTAVPRRLRQRRQSGSGGNHRECGQHVRVRHYSARKRRWNLRITPDSLAFAPQRVGTTSAPHLVRVSNPGATPLKVTSITISGDFAQTDNCSVKLKTGKDCTIKVTFSPTQTGTRTGTLSIKDSALSSVQEIPLTERGT
jgi:hypothetical protein